MWKSTNCKVCNVVFTLENKKKKRGSCISCYKKEECLRVKESKGRTKKFKNEFLLEMDNKIKKRGV